MFDIEAILIENGMKRTVFFCVAAKHVNEIVGDLYEKGATSVTVIEVSDKFHVLPCSLDEPNYSVSPKALS